jgi:hypothetical protein
MGLFQGGQANQPVRKSGQIPRWPGQTVQKYRQLSVNPDLAFLYRAMAAVQPGNLLETRPCRRGRDSCHAPMARLRCICDSRSAKPCAVLGARPALVWVLGSGELETKKPRSARLLIGYVAVNCCEHHMREGYL